jgi:hypothetical protein
MVRLDGVPQVPLSANSGSYASGLATEEVPLIGLEVPEVDGINGLKVLTMDLNANPWLIDLLDAQEAKNAGRSEVEMDAEFSVDYGGGVVRRRLMPDCVASDHTLTIGGSTDRLTESVTLTSSTAIPR